MTYKKLGTTDLSVSVLGIGTWQFSGEWGKQFIGHEVNKILELAESLGINLIDTAECYGNHLSEKLIGASIKRNKNRSKWIVATKFGHTYKGFLDVNECWSPTEVKKQLDGSLNALCTDYIDIYQFHSGSDNVFDNDKLWQMLEKEKQSGKIRYLGISLSEQTVMDDNLHQLHKAKERDVDVIQIRYNWLHREAEKNLLPECVKLKLGVLIRQPLAYGYLSGKYDVYHQFPKNDVRHWHNKNSFFKEINLVRELRHDLGNDIDMTNWSLTWCLKNKCVDSILVGCKSIEQMKSNSEIIENYENPNSSIQ